MKALVCLSLLSLIFVTTASAKSKYKLKKTRIAPRARFVEAGRRDPYKNYRAAHEWLKKVHPCYKKYSIEQIANLKKLSLQLYSRETVKLITDANMVHVGKLKKLETLRVHRLIGSAGFAHFANLKKLKILNAPNCINLTDSGLTCVKQMPQLENLVICATKIGDSSMAHLKGRTGLRLLNITRTKVSDAGFAKLKNLKNLNKLFISYTNLTDASVPIIKGFTHLNTLYMQGTKISKAGKDEIAAALKGARIVR